MNYDQLKHKLSTCNISVCRAESEVEIEKAIDIRWRGYKKYFSKRQEVIDAFDSLKRTCILLAVNKDDSPLGTLRIIYKGNVDDKFELESFVNLGSSLSDKELPSIEVSRFSVPRNKNSDIIKFLLWKSVFKYCLEYQIETIFIWVRPSAAREYSTFFFRNIGPHGIFAHPLLNRVHQTYKTDFKRGLLVCKRFKPDLYSLFASSSSNIHL